MSRCDGEVTDMSVKSDLAADATSAVQGCVAKALDALNDYRIDEQEIFAIPTERRRSLMAAQEAIIDALNIMDATTWSPGG
ncbi:MAG TPA: hypothetical protein VN809_04360 [Telmatospirillum sp.]|nr:hypothetical protein [Telmatospirillum sp.]